jgi:HK97 family phage portal protein
MNFFARAIKAFKTVSRMISLDDFDKLIDVAMNGRQSVTGININSDTAMNFSAFFNGVLQICQTVASLPLMLYKRTSNGKRRYTEHPLYKLLHDRANPYLPAFTWREIMTNHIILNGNAYSYIERDRGYRPTALWPLNPQKVFPKWKDGKVVYLFRDSGKEIEYAYDEILHIPGFGYDGLKGYAVLEVARESIGIGLSLEEFQARFIKNGAHIGGILQTKKVLGPEGRKNLRDSFTEAYTSAANAGKFPVLENDVTFEKTGMSLVDAQFLASRVFSVQEIARWLNMPPHKLKEQSHATYSNVESENLSFFQDTIRPYLVRIEANTNHKLTPDDGYCEFVFDAILRADILTRYRAYQIARNAGVLSGDEWRKFENWDEIPDEMGKMFVIPANMVNMGTLLKTDEESSIDEVGTTQNTILDFQKESESTKEKVKNEA